MESPYTEAAKGLIKQNQELRDALAAERKEKETLIEALNQISTEAVLFGTNGEYRHPVGICTNIQEIVETTLAKYK